jgi:hypothetical protein
MGGGVPRLAEPVCLPDCVARCGYEYNGIGSWEWARIRYTGNYRIGFGSTAFTRECPRSFTSTCRTSSRVVCFLFHWLPAFQGEPERSATTFSGARVTGSDSVGHARHGQSRMGSLCVPDLAVSSRSGSCAKAAVARGLVDHIWRRGESSKESRLGVHSNAGLLVSFHSRFPGEVTTDEQGTERRDSYHSDPVD